MGANLVMQVFASWTHVSDRAFRVLVRMAVTALDTPSKGQPAGIYHGGRDLLAMSLRSKGGSDRTRYRSVAEAVAELTEAGAIEHLATGWAGQKAVYRLTLSRPGSVRGEYEMGGSTDHPMGVLRDHPVDGSTAHPMDVPTARKWMGPEHTPRNQEEPIKEREEEGRGDLPTASHPPHATETAAPVIHLADRRPADTRPLKRPGSRSEETAQSLRDASARVAARKAAHQARLAAEQEIS